MSDGTIGQAPDLTKKDVRIPGVGSFQFKDDNGIYTPLTNRHKLMKLADGRFVFTMKDSTVYKFNSAGYLNSIADRNGNTTSITVDSTGKITKITDSTGRIFAVNYNTSGFIDNITDATASRSTKYVYTAGNLTKATQSSGVSYNYTYDAQNLLKEIRDTSNVLLESINYNTTGSNIGKVNYLIDEYNNKKTYIYDDVSRVTTVRDQNNRDTKEWYDLTYSISSKVDPDNKSTMRTYNKDSNSMTIWDEELSIKDRNDNVTSFTRDSNGNITSASIQNNGSKRFWYDEKNNITGSVDEEGNYTYFEYNLEKSLLVKKALYKKPYVGSTLLVSNATNIADFAVTTYEYYTDAENTTLGYKEKGLLKKVTDPLLNATTYSYFADGTIKDVTIAKDPENATPPKATYTYNSLRIKSSELSPKGNKSEYFYDLDGRVEKAIKYDGTTAKSIVRITYDSMGRKTKEVSPNQYNATLDNLAAHTYSGDQGTRYTYYPNGLVKTEKNAENLVNEYTYDIYGNVSTKKLPNGSIYIFYYDIMNRPWKTAFKDNSTATEVLLEENLYSTVTAGQTKKTVNKYYDIGKFNTTIFTYDYAGNQIRVDYPDKTYTTSEYYNNGAKKKDTDAKLVATEYTYGKFNLLSQVKIPFETVGATTYYTIKSYTYDDNGKMLTESITNNKPGAAQTFRSTTYKYNKRGLLSMVTLSEGATPVNYTQYCYDAEGNKIRMYTGLSKPLTINALDSLVATGDTAFTTTKYDYNYLGKLKAITDNAAKLENYEYDLNGNNTKVVDRNLSASLMTYDFIDRIKTKNVTNTDITKNAQYSYTYDPVSGYLKTKSGEGYTTTYGYDTKGRVISETESNGIVKNYSYYPNDLRKTYTIKQGTVVKSSLGYDYTNMDRLFNVKEGTVNTATYVYDANGNRTSLQYNNGNISTYTYNLANKVKSLVNKTGTTVLSQFTYTYYLDGNQESKTQGTAKTAYVYDGLGRLKQEIAPTITKTYTFDDNGNRKTMAVTGTGAHTVNYEYGLVNQLLKENKIVGVTTTASIYTYDANGNQLTKTVGTTKETYGYDGFDQLKKYVNGTTTITYKYDANGLRQGKTIGAITTTHIWDGQDNVMDLAGTTISGIYVRGINLIYGNFAGTKKYYLFNAHGDVVGLSSTTGASIKKYDYDAFGVEIGEVATDTNPYRYSGEYWDKETKTVYLRARYYTPGNGRFLSQDSVLGGDGDPLSLNLYTYCINNPIMYFDPSGHDAIDDLISFFTDPVTWFDVKILGTVPKAKGIASKIGTVSTVLSIYSFANWEGDYRKKALNHLEEVMSGNKNDNKYQLLVSLDRKSLNVNFGDYSKQPKQMVLNLRTNNGHMKTYNDLSEKEKALLIVNMCQWDPGAVNDYINGKIIEGTIDVITSK